MKVFLVGLPGCGKTTLGKVIAKQMNCDFVDLDHEISVSEKNTIASIFQEYGESYFRKIESEHLKNWCAKPDHYIMATGGGTPCFLSNMELINRSGVSIFLDTPVDEIAQRMKNTKLDKRPLFTGQTVNTIAGRVQKMRNERISFYTQAKLAYASDHIASKNLVKDLRGLEWKT